MANDFPVIKFRDPETGTFIGFPALKGDTGAPGPNSISTATDISVAGLLKGLDGKVAQAVAGTDYVTPYALNEVTSQLADKANQATTYTKTDVDTKIGAVQSQVDVLVVEGDSSVEAAQARVAASGGTFGTLKERLDNSDTKLAAIDGVVGVYKIPYPNPITATGQKGGTNLVACGYKFSTSELIGDEINVSFRLTVGKTGLPSTERYGINLYIYESNGDFDNYNTNGAYTQLHVTPDVTSAHIPDGDEFVINRTLVYTPAYNYLFVLPAVNPTIGYNLELINFAASISATIDGDPIQPVSVGIAKTFGKNLRKDWLGVTNRFKNHPGAKKVSILADSISTFVGYIPAANRARYPQSDLLTEVNETWWKLLINETGMTLGINESWAGSRVTWDGTTESADIGADKHIASTTRITNLGDNGTPDFIIIYAGTNDIGNAVTLGTFDDDDPTGLTQVQIDALPVDTFASAYRTMLIRVLKMYQTSRVIVILPTWTTAYFGTDEVDNYNEVVKECCDYFGVEWFDTRTAGITPFNRATYLPDGTHPNAAGMEILYKFVLNNIKKYL